VVSKSEILLLRYYGAGIVGLKDSDQTAAGPMLLFRLFDKAKQCFGSGSSLIGIDFSLLDLDPGGQKWPSKIEKEKKFHVLKCWMFSFNF
jgi:hypothetical protein